MTVCWMCGACELTYAGACLACVLREQTDKSEPIDGFKYDGRCQVVGCDTQATVELEELAPNKTKMRVCEEHRELKL
jgi:hypothetical protein